MHIKVDMFFLLKNRSNKTIILNIHNTIKTFLKMSIENILNVILSPCTFKYKYKIFFFNLQNLKKSKLHLLFAERKNIYVMAQDVLAPLCIVLIPI